MALVGTFPFNAFLSGVLSCIGTSVLGGTFSRPFLFSDLDFYITHVVMSLPWDQGVANISSLANIDCYMPFVYTMFVISS